MTDKKKETKKPEIKLQPIQLAYTLNTYVPTEKGLYMWLAPLGTTWDDSLKSLEDAKIKTKEFKAQALKKQAEEEAAKNKPPAENKVEKFKQV